MPIYKGGEARHKSHGAIAEACSANSQLVVLLESEWEVVSKDFVCT